MTRLRPDYLKMAGLGAAGLLCAALLASAGPACAAVTAGRIFSDNMILQRDVPSPVWGTAAPGETVVVSFGNQEKTTKADADGKWRVQLDPLQTGRAATLTIRGEKAKDTIAFTDVLAGEVWIGTGQSNMDGRTGGYRRQDEVLDAWAKDAAGMPLRFYDNQKGAWRPPSQETINQFSALGFSFIYSLSKELAVPVGMMVVAEGGQPSVKWITREMAAASSDPVLRKYGQPGYTGEASSVAPEDRNMRRVRTLDLMGCHYVKIKELYYPYGIRGVLWDQGEAGTCLDDVDQFTAMSALIAGWRRDWGQGDFPFLHIQKPSGGGCAWDPSDPVNRKARAFRPQPDKPSRISREHVRYALEHLEMRTISNAPLVTAVDLAPGIHPPTKSAYGARACRVALGTVYGRGVEIYGPIYRSHKVEGDRMRVEFDHVGKGLAFKHGDKLQGFEIAGADGQWDWAEAAIDGDTVVLHNPRIPSPMNVRYAYSPRPDYANLFNRAGLPALLFTTEKLPKSERAGGGRF